MSNRTDPVQTSAKRIVTCTVCKQAVQLLEVAAELVAFDLAESSVVIASASTREIVIGHRVHREVCRDYAFARERREHVEREEWDRRNRRNRTEGI